MTRVRHTSNGSHDAVRFRSVRSLIGAAACMSFGCAREARRSMAGMGSTVFVRVLILFLYPEACIFF